MYQLASRLDLPDLAQAAGAAGVISVLEVSAHYGWRRLRHSVARIFEHQLGDIELHMAYEGVRLERSPRLAIDSGRMEAVNTVLLAMKFRTLSDQQDLTHDEPCLWLIRQASGVHIHSVTLAPDRPQLPYSAIVNAIDDHLPQAIRELPLRAAR